MGVVAYKDKFYAGSINEDTKADITAIAYNEDGATCENSNGYKIGEHFYKDGKFCTAKAAIASGETFTLNTNYVEGTIADAVSNTYSGQQSVTFNNDGVGAINDSKIKAGDIIILQKQKAEYGIGIALTCGNVYNGVVYLYANTLDGTHAKYQGTCNINYIGHRTI